MTSPDPVLQIAGTAPLKVWTLDGAERLARQCRAQRRPLIRHDDPVPAGASLMIVRADCVMHGFVLKALARNPGIMLVDSGQLIAVHVPADKISTRSAVHQAVEQDDVASLASFGLLCRSARDIAPAYDSELRTRADTYAMRVSQAEKTRIENRMFNAVYKGSTDFVTRGWLIPARAATRWVAQFPFITPNLITLVGLLLCVYAGYAFATGNYGLGLIAGWIFMFFDTLDGKLARVTVTSSALGNFLDHGVDLVHPPFWYWLWWVGLQPPASSWRDYVPGFENPYDLSVWVLFAFYCVGRVIEGLFILLGGFHIHIWKKIDHYFRYVTSRRNPNMVVLTLAALAGQHGAGLVIIAAWAVLSNLFHLVRLVQAYVAKARGEKIGSFLETEASAP